MDRRRRVEREVDVFSSLLLRGEGRMWWSDGWVYTIIEENERVGICLCVCCPFV